MEGCLDTIEAANANAQALGLKRANQARPQLYEKTCCLPLHKKSLDLKRSESGSTGAVGSLQGLLGWTSHTPQCDFRGAHHDWKTLSVAREKLTLTDSGRKLYLGGASFQRSQLKISAAWNKHNAGHLYFNDNKRVRIMMSKTATTTQTTRIFTQNYLGGKRQKRLKHIEDWR